MCNSLLWARSLKYVMLYSRENSDWLFYSKSVHFCSRVILVMGQFPMRLKTRQHTEQEAQASSIDNRARSEFFVFGCLFGTSGRINVICLLVITK